MNHSIDPLLPGMSAEQEHKTPALSPLVLACARGLTLAGWAAMVIVNGIYGVTIRWGVGPIVDFVVMALAGFLFVALFDGVFTISSHQRFAVRRRDANGTEELFWESEPGYTART
ncbi:MAG: hypothetical protein M9896_04695 [Candidatus Promineofilum sp.]|uniref:hypothetical protein n=1 Tax=Promineifilum sp. TaxID=2664178 RepID=UPI002411A7D6|nr:hypothetical protein [Promineifilum sp.]